MKMMTYKKEVTKSQNFEESQFKIENNVEAFKILSTNLYSDGIGAIIRELGTNAADSHKEAGNDDPFEVILPSYFDRKFIIRDYGTGLSPDDIKEIYTVYFSSNKRHTNELNGCLGLGSKSPLGYCESFIVESFFDGIHYTYNVGLNKDELPTITKLSEQKTNEPSGLKITIPVKSEDSTAFETKAYDIYSMFENPPLVDGEQVESLLPKSKFFFHPRINHPSVWMGNVCYKFDIYKIDGIDTGSCDVIENIVLRAKIGDIDFAPNREEVRYSEKTQKFIKSKLEKEVSQTFIKDIKKYLEDYGSLYSAKMNLGSHYDIEKKLQFVDSQDDDITYLKRSQDFIFDPQSDLGKKILDVYGRCFVNYKKEISIPIMENIEVIEKDKTYHKTFMKRYTKDSWSRGYVVLEDGAGDDFIKEIRYEDCEVKKLSDIYTVPERAGRGTKDTYNFYTIDVSAPDKKKDRWANHYGDRSEYVATLENISPSVGSKYYYITKEQAEKYQGRTAKDYDSLAIAVNFLAKYCGFERNVKILLANSKKSIQKAKMSKNFINFLDFVNERLFDFEGFIPTKQYVLDYSTTSWLDFFKNKKISTKGLAKVRKTSIISKKHTLIEDLISCFDKFYKKKLETEKVDYSIDENYPLLKYFDSHDLYSEDTNHLVNYMKGVENDEI